MHKPWIGIHFCTSFAANYYVLTSSKGLGMKKQILVPTDFTKVAECAISHALEIAESIDGEVNLLHVIAKSSQVEDAKSKLADQIERYSKLTEIVLTSTVRIGNIFDDIGDVASENNAELIVMGTHGMKGMQFITGSHALKVITHSHVPFIVVQDKPVKVGFNDIVVPLDLSKETKQKLSLVANMADYFSSKIHLITPKETDEYLHNQLDRNLLYAEKYFKERKIEYTTEVSKASSGGFEKALLAFAVEKDADLIAIMNLSDNNLLNLGGGREQHLITNEAQIPVMIANPIQKSVSGGSVLFS